VWLQYYALVTFYYSTGGATGLWSNDRIWLSTEPLCDWLFVICTTDSRTSDDGVYQESGDNMQRNPDDDIVVREFNAGTLLVVIVVALSTCYCSPCG
jgi:hypothetical protein